MTESEIIELIHKKAWEARLIFEKSCFAHAYALVNGRHDVREYFELIEIGMKSDILFSLIQDIKMENGKIKEREELST